MSYVLPYTMMLARHLERSSMKYLEGMRNALLDSLHTRFEGLFVWLADNAVDPSVSTQYIAFN